MASEILDDNHACISKFKNRTTALRISFNHKNDEINVNLLTKKSRSVLFQLAMARSLLKKLLPKPFSVCFLWSFSLLILILIVTRPDLAQAMPKLYFRHGAVSSAKTLNLLAVAHNYRVQGKCVVVMKV